MKTYKTFKIEESTLSELNTLSFNLDIKKNELIKGMIRFFKSNQTLITADFFQKSNDKTTSEEYFEKLFARQMKKEINRLIGFLKVQDKNLELFREHLFHKLDNKQGQEFHPLFAYQDYVLNKIEQYLESQGQTFKDINKSIFKNEGLDEANKFINSMKNLREKTLKY